ncbi:chemotaxis protein CheB [Solilutibacter pythonis]|uniref:chemotaxis protein CheB n=1 Tax=Solilutibacter pythonis TaxID=2483112 RepID=UPI0011C45967|nr:chemotaxis protein CheB [Lysobacter pythonis]
METRTVVLARPGPAREQLLTAMAGIGIEPVMVVDPLETTEAEILALAPRNVVIAVDPTVDEALERFDALLGDPDLRLLIEEADLVVSRTGWDVARWSRHLAAKLFGHDDVLPFGHEADEAAVVISPPTRVETAEPVLALEAGTEAAGDAAAPEVADEVFSSPLHEREVAPVAETAELALALETEAGTETAGDVAGPEVADEISFPLLHEREAAPVAETAAPEVADEVFSSPLHEREVAPVADGASFPAVEAGPSDDLSGLTLTPDIPIAPEELDLLERAPDFRADAPAGDTGDEWASFHEYDDSAFDPGRFSTDHRDVLAPPESENDLAPEEAYRRSREALEQFQTGDDGDRWQDFERPVPEASESQAPSSGSPSIPAHWNLTDEPLAPVAGEGKADETAQRCRLDALEEKISSLRLVDEEANHGHGHEGVVVLVGGIGGPDPLRQILQQLAPGFPVPVVVQQWLDGGQYDRLVRQMSRATRLPVVMAEPGQSLAPGVVHIVPPSLGLSRESAERTFVPVDTRAFADLLASLPAASSALLLLSGGTEDFVEPALRFLQSGGQLLAQAAEGCYDHTVPALLISRGARAEPPAGMATWLNHRWPAQESK